MSNGIRYRVQTHWGYFSLDEDSYQDYLAGKLWIIWKPGKTETPKPEAELTHLSAEAIRLRESAHADAYSLLQVRFPATAITPYQKRMENVGIDELLLSVRSSNGCTDIKKSPRKVCDRLISVIFLAISTPDN